MRERYDIFNSLKSAFLATQNTITSIQPGSIVDSLLYANSLEIAKAFEEVDVLKSNLYIDTATGSFLDSLITGFSRLSRIQGKPSIGYVLVELGTPIDLSNIENFKITFSKYNQDGSITFNYQSSTRFTVSNTSGRSVEFALLGPLNYSVSDNDYLVSSINAEQNILSFYKEYLKILLNKYKKPIKYLVLPVGSISTGSFTAVPSGSIDVSLNIGFPCTIKNMYTFSGDAYNAYRALKVLSTQTTSSVIMADVDNIVFNTNNTYGLGDFSYISGGIDNETDDLYRARFYNYLSSLSGGTIDAINSAILTEFPNSKLSIVEASNPGSIDVFIDSSTVLSRPILQRITSVVDNVKPAGIFVNVKPTKNLYVSVLVDIQTDSFTDSTNNIKSGVQASLDAKPLGSSVSYDELYSIIFDPNIQKKDNIFYGEFLNSVVFNLYKETFQKIYWKFGVRPSARSDTAPLWSLIEYYDVYNQVANNDSSIYITYKNADLKFPLLSLVRRALDLSVVEKDALSASSKAIVDKIVDVCSGKKASQCMNSIMSFSSYKEDVNSLDIAAINAGEKISIANLAEIVNKEYAVYFKAKLLTIPFIRKEIPQTAIELIKTTLLNDVMYLSYDDLSEVSLSSVEKIKIARDFTFSTGIYADSSMVTTRPIER